MRAHLLLLRLMHMRDQEHQEHLDRLDRRYLFLRRIAWVLLYAMLFTWVIVVAMSGKV